jgi:hypothetical protein
MRARGKKGITLMEPKGVLGMSVITAGICYQERNRAAMLPGLRAMLTGEEDDNLLRMFLDLRR